MATTTHIGGITYDPAFPTRTALRTRRHVLEALEIMTLGIKGEAPVAYAWSYGSKRRRGEWFRVQRMFVANS